jgi:amino acid transporter
MVRQLTGDQDVAGALAAERLGRAGVIFFMLAAAAPLTVVAGTLAMAYAVTGSPGLPMAFLVVGAILGMFAVGYVTMSRFLPHAGALYAYVAHGVGRPVGVGAAWVSILAYDLIQVSLYGTIGAAVSPLVEQAIGVTVPWWIYAVMAWSLVALLGVARVDLNGGVLAVLLICEVAVIGVYVAAFLAHPAHGYAVSAWSPTGLTQGGAGAILAIAVLGFVGFESGVTFTEESRDPTRTIPSATYLSLIMIAGLYGISAWAVQVAAGSDQIAGMARTLGPDLVFTLAVTRLGPAAGTLGHVLFATSILAAMLSFHNTTARYLYALGREGVLPTVFGHTSRAGAPHIGSLTQSTIGLTVIIGFAVSGADPVVWLFYTASTSGALGILILLTLAAIAVIGFFQHDPRGQSTWRTRTAPTTSLTGLMVVLVLVVANIATLLGIPDTSPLRWGIPGTYLAIGLTGTGYGLYLKAHRPAVYAAIGHGAKTALDTLPSRSRATTPQRHPDQASPTAAARSVTIPSPLTRRAGNEGTPR